MVRALSTDMRALREDMMTERRRLREAFAEELWRIRQASLVVTPSLSQPPSGIPAQRDPNSERDSNQHPIDWHSETQMSQADADYAMNSAAALSPSDLLFDSNPQPPAGGSPYQFPWNPALYGSTAFDVGWIPAPDVSQAHPSDFALDSPSQANLDFTQGSSQGQTTRETGAAWQPYDWNDILDNESQEERE